MKKTIVALLIASATLTAAPATAVTTGPLAVSTSPLSINTSSSCATVPITWYLTSAPSGVTTWTVDGDIVDSAGASRGWIFEYENLPVTQAGESFQMCGLAEGTTSFTVAADIDAWTSEYTMYSTRFVGSLTVTRTTPPPPPPPPPVTINTRMVVDGAPIWFMRRTYARIGAVIEFRGPCSSGRRDVTMSGKRSAGGWKRITGWTVDETAYLKARVPHSFRTVRFETTATQVCTADTTLPLKVPRRS
jgi:hypothetical protein